MSIAEENMSTSQAHASKNAERKARVNAAWEKMNSGISVKTPKLLVNKSSSTGNKTVQKSSSNWMANLGLVPKKASSRQDMPQKRPASVQNGTSEDVKRLAAAALSAVKDAAAVAAAAAGRGKVEITEVRDFAGEEIEVKKLVDADSKEAAEKAKAPTGPPSGLDAVLEQIKKKQKLNVLDKTKKDWGEFKEENKGLEDELDAYKKSSNQYLDRVSFLQRTDYREFERERDARLALQARRRPDMRDES
ncbi:uncharacterized protein LOC131224798 isoform X5 [Magnolia sinica]|nr:uncharacterized protein LOC131224798 isoform X5 [Magnolia sinica]